MILGLVFKQAMILGLVSEQGMMIGMVVQQAIILRFSLELSMIVGMTFQQAMIVGLYLTSHDYKHGHLGDHDCRTVFRANCDISSYLLVDILNHLLALLTNSPGLRLCDQVAGTKVS